MPRAQRVLVPGAVYHVYNRLARTERVLADEAEAGRFLARVSKVRDRDELTVLAYCVMSNHYHLALRMGEVPLSRSMRSIQREFTVSFNGRHQVLGPLWQGRYKAKLVEDAEQLCRLVAYIHLNPVAAGLVDDPVEHRFSGHRSMVGRGRRRTILDADEALAVFGETRREALRNYRVWLAATLGEEWLDSEPGQLPWWRLGRPKSKLVDEVLSIDESRPRIGVGGHSSTIERPETGVRDLIERGAVALGWSGAEIVGPSRMRRLIEAREILTIVGVERYGLKVKEIAAAMGRAPETASRWISRGTERRQSDREYRACIGRVDRAIASGEIDESRT